MKLLASFHHLFQGKALLGAGDVVPLDMGMKIVCRFLDPYVSNRIECAGAYQRKVSLCTICKLKLAKKKLPSVSLWN